MPTSFYTDWVDWDRKEKMRDADVITLPLTEQPTYRDHTHCKHGTFVGDPYGSDYMCPWCESGEEPPEFTYRLWFSSSEPTTKLQVFQWGIQIYPLMPIEFPVVPEVSGEITDIIASLMLDGFEPWDHLSWDYYNMFIYIHLHGAEFGSQEKP
jgi:hypothetical protein